MEHHHGHSTDCQGTPVMSKVKENLLHFEVKVLHGGAAWASV